MERTLKELRNRGYLAEKVEQRLPIPGKYVTRDFLGFIDIIAVSKTQIVGVQATSGSNHANHREKILAESRYLVWKEAGAAVLLMSWAKKGPRGKRKTWQLREDWL
jgi:hypothetical protein